MRRKNAEDQGAQPSAEGRITPAEVQQVEFRLAFRGYNERDVDAFLDRITEDLSAYADEVERLSGGASATFAPATAASGDVDAARRETDAILSRAREEAAAIVRRAQQEAAAIRAAGGSASGEADTRAAIAPFLNTEREFLQSLGGLVQNHAEEIKQMVLALRAQVDAAAARSAPAPPAPSSSDQRGPSTGDAASAAEIRERLGEPERPATTAPSDPIVIEDRTEPAYSSEGAAGEGRERSLRELFWGED
jgi:DivIVA domain-containing protein